MNKIDAIKTYVKQAFGNSHPGHGWMHAYRVFSIATKLQKMEGGDLFIIQSSALLHDLVDRKIKIKTLDQISSYLHSLYIDENKIKQILDIINSISFSKSLKLTTIEAKIVQDADRLDAIGAIGIARAFTYGGLIKRQIYGNSSTIQHFYDKLLLLKDRMNTKSAKLFAYERDKFMRSFLERFFKEIEAKDLKDTI